jgi:hypothetical protein
MKRRLDFEIISDHSFDWSLLEVIPERPACERSLDSNDTPALKKAEHGYVNHSSLTGLFARGLYKLYGLV